MLRHVPFTKSGAAHLGCGFRTRLLKVFKVHHFSHDEALLEIRVDFTRRLWGEAANLDGPSLDFVLSAAHLAR